MLENLKKYRLVLASNSRAGKNFWRGWMWIMK